MTDRILILRPDGSHSEASTGGVRPTLKDLQDWVGGYIQMVPVIFEGQPGQFICNEDGISMELPPNMEATRLFEGQVMFSGAARGTVLVLQGRMMMK